MGVVTGRPWRRVACVVVAWWKTMPARARGRVAVVVISTNGGIEGVSLGAAGGAVSQRRAGTGDEQTRDEPPAQLQGLVADGVHAVEVRP